MSESSAPEAAQGPVVPSSDDLRDALALQLLDVVTNGVKDTIEDADGKKSLVSLTPSPAYLNLLVQYLKAFPPASQPTENSATGLLRRHAKVLPFGLKKTGTGTK